MKSYIICTTQRSGSSMLCSLLTQTGLLGVPGEGLLYLELRRDDLGEKMQEIKDLPFKKGLKYTKKERTVNGAFGIKIMASTLRKLYKKSNTNDYDQPTKTFKLLSKYFDKPEYIFLRRADKVKQAISHTYLRKTGTAHALNKTDLQRIRGEKLNIEIENEDVDIDLKRIFKDELLWKNYFLVNNIQPLILDFEDIIENKNSAMKRITDALGVETSLDFDSISPKTKKISDGSENLFIKNYKKRLKSIYSDDFLSLYDMEKGL